MSKYRALIVMMVLNLALVATVAYRVSVPTTQRALVTRVSQRASEVQLQPHERLWEKIGWAPSFQAALEASRTTGRPVLFVAMDGQLDGLC